MAEDATPEKINLDGIEYDVSGLSENGRAQLIFIQFVDMQLQQLNNELAVADTARIGYSNALKAEVAKIKVSK